MSRTHLRRAFNLAAAARPLAAEKRAHDLDQLLLLLELLKRQVAAARHDHQALRIHRTADDTGALRYQPRSTATPPPRW